MYTYAYLLQFMQIFISAIRVVVICFLHTEINKRRILRKSKWRFGGVRRSVSSRVSHRKVKILKADEVFSSCRSVEIKFIDKTEN